MTFWLQYCSFLCLVLDKSCTLVLNTLQFFSECFCLRFLYHCLFYPAWSWPFLFFPPIWWLRYFFILSTYDPLLLVEATTEVFLKLLVWSNFYFWINPLYWFSPFFKGVFCLFLSVEVILRLEEVFLVFRYLILVDWLLFEIFLRVISNSSGCFLELRFSLCLSSAVVSR